MSEIQGELLEAGPAVRSGVKIDTNSKGFAQTKVQVYEGTTEEEMERIKNLAVTTYQKTIAMLGAAASLS
jgi:hypothetical protein